LSDTTEPVEVGSITLRFYVKEFNYTFFCFELSHAELVEACMFIILVYWYSLKNFFSKSISLA